MTQKATFNTKNAATEAPVEHEDERGDKRFTHPSFAAISASRVSGRAYLFGSEFDHQHFVNVTISLCDQMRSLSRDWYYDHDPQVTVAMSEAQWAQFVSTMNAGGVPCTLQRMHGKMMPQLPRPRPKSDIFKEEMGRRMADAQDGLKQLRELLSAAGLSQKRREELERTISGIEASIGNSAGFVADQFGEHMEAQQAAAKTEIVAYAMRAFMGLGAEAARTMLTQEEGKAVLPSQAAG